MLRDPFGHPLRSSVQGWHSLALLPADRAADHPGLGELAALVRAGALEPDSPVFVATHESPGGGLPEIVVAVPLTHAELVAWRAGDTSVSRDVVDALEEAYLDLLERARENRMDDGG